MNNEALKIQRKSISLFYVVFLIIVVFSSFISNVVYCQTDGFFEAFDEFEIPNTKGLVKFAFGGTYEKASLENNTWSFSNLKIDSNQNQQKISFKVSLVDCIVVITSIRVYNRTVGSETAKRVSVNYDLVGDGIQMFDLDLDPDKGDWGVRFNQVYVSENRGWSVSSQGIITITGEATNVSFSYYGLPDSFFNKSFVDQHFISIVIAAVMIVVVILSLLIKIKKTK